MNFIRITGTFVILALFFSCKKEVAPQVINNYYTQAGDGAITVNPKILKEYGLADSSQVVNFTYYNNEPYKFQEMLYKTSGVPSDKIAIFYDSEGNPDYFQVLTLPGNVLQSQGEFFLDVNKNISKVLHKTPIGDTISTISYTYSYLANKYKLSSKIIVDSLGDQKHEYFYYDANGLMTKNIGYKKGVSGLYKDNETESFYSNAINPFPHIQFYAILVQHSLESSASFYFSHYVPNLVKTQYYNEDGSPSTFQHRLNDNFVLDTDNHVTNLNNYGTPVYFKY